MFILNFMDFICYCSLKLGEFSSHNIKVHQFTLVHAHIFYERLFFYLIVLSLFLLDIKSLKDFFCISYFLIIIIIFYEKEGIPALESFSFLVKILSTKYFKNKLRKRQDSYKILTKYLLRSCLRSKTWARQKNS